VLEASEEIMMEYNMKKFLLGGVAALAFASQAFAADLPSRSMVTAAPPIFVPPAFTWTGFYAGVNAGYNFGDNDATTIGTPGFVGLGGFVPSTLRTSRDGFIGGGQVGYNQQYGMFVLGIEADLQFVDGKRTTSFTSGALGGLTTSAGTQSSYLGTVRGRIGLTASDRLLVYATGGLAYGNPENTAAVAAPAVGAFWGGSSDSVRTGYAVGGGVEYAFTNNLTAKLEYLYYDLGRRTVTASALTGPAAATGIAYQARFDNTGQIVRAGLNYKF
jgi:outer membrane immunogenic protein